MASVDGKQLIPQWYYFYNLENNFHDNVNGECTWVAETIYLSYLKTCQRKGVIPTNYFVNSVGSGNDVSSYASSPGIWDGASQKQYDELEDFYSHFVSEYSSSYYTYPSLGYNPEFFTKYCKQIDLMNEYLSNCGHNLNKDYFIAEASSVLNMNYVYNFIIDELHNGRPVIANTPSHSFIVYGYVQDTKQLVVHNGWKNGHTHDIFDCDNSNVYPGIQYAFSVSFYNHEHSYQYVDDPNAYCVCGDDVYIHPYYHKHDMSIHHAHGKIIFFSCTICDYMEGMGQS